MKINFVFLGTPQVASRTLDILAEKGYLPSLIVTSPDKPKGRGLVMTPSPVSIWGESHNIPVLKPEKLTDKFINEIKNSHFDLAIVVAYGKILPESLIITPKLGTINIHYSLLPKWRGASPLEAALLHGDPETGVAIQQMAYKLDSGPILAKKEISIDDKITKEELKNKLIDLGGNLLSEIMPDIAAGTIKPAIQDESKATYCTKTSKEDGKISLEDDGKKNYNKYRAFSGWPGTYFFTEKNGKKIRVIIKEAIYENGQFTILKVTPEGKKELNYTDFLKQISISK